MKLPGEKRINAYLALFGGLSFMCFAAILIKASGAPGIITTFYRMTIGTLFLTIPFVVSRIKSEHKLPKKGVILALLAGVCFGNDMAIWSTGVNISNATIPTLFANTAPLWVGLGTMFVFKEKHKTSFWVGLFLALSGIPMIVFKDLHASNGIIKGGLLGLGAGVFYGIFYLLAQSSRKLIDTISFLYIYTLTAAVILFSYSLIFGYHFIGYDTNTYLIFVAFGLGVQVIGWYLISYSQGFLPATIVAPTLLGQPVLTAFLATLLLNEHLTLWHIVGGIIVITGIYIIHFSKK